MGSVCCQAWMSWGDPIRLLAPFALQEDINAVSKSADAIKKKLAELDRHNEQVGVVAEQSSFLCVQQAGLPPGNGNLGPPCEDAEPAAPAASVAVPQAQGVRARQQQRAHAHRHHGRAEEKAQGLDGGVPRPEVGGWGGTAWREGMPAEGPERAQGPAAAEGSVGAAASQQGLRALCRHERGACAPFLHPAAPGLPVPPQVSGAG